MMIRYWDLEEAERAELTEEQVRDFCKVEIMEKGVLQAKRPEPLDETAPEPEKRNVYKVTHNGGYSWRQTIDDLCFDTAEQADAFIALRPSRVKTDNQTALNMAERYEELGVEIDEVANRESVARHRIELERAAKNKDHNAQAQRDYEKQLKAVREATSGIWEDWHACRERSKHLETIRRTMDEYREMTGGDEEVAAKFLLRAYDREDCEAALPDLELPPSEELTDDAV